MIDRKARRFISSVIRNSLDFSALYLLAHEADAEQIDPADIVTAILWAQRGVDAPPAAVIEVYKRIPIASVHESFAREHFDLVRSLQ